MKLMPICFEFQKEMPQFFSEVVDKSVEKKGITRGIGGQFFPGLSLRR